MENTEFWLCASCDCLNPIANAICFTCGELNPDGYHGWIHKNITLNSPRIDKDLGELCNDFNSARLLGGVWSFTKPMTVHEFFYEILIGRFLPHKKYKPTEHWESFIK